ncbi:MAG: DNA polymerase III subunit delta [Paludibacteraceae bacterium]|nr:DNA polymerase III subunit delta [Paludibacteraceae bacterium]
MKTYDQIIDELRKQRYAPVYFLYGKEPYYIDKVSDFIEHYVLDESEKAFDQQVLYGRDLNDIGPVLSAARRFPMMAPYQVIILKEAQAVRKWDNFDLYLQNPAEKTILVICYKGEPDKRLKVFRGIDKSPYALLSSPLRDYQVNKWILDYIRDWNAQAKATNQVSIDERVVQLLADSLGNDLTRITLELKKLIDGRPEGVNVIDAALVERNIGISKDYNGFELQHAFVTHDAVKANRITQYFAANRKEHAIQKELALVFSFFSNLMIYHYLPDKSQQAVVQKLGVSPNAVKDYAAAARLYSKGKVFAIIGYIRETDARSKGIDNPSADEADLWKELIYKILH